MMVENLGFILDMEPTAITLKFFSLSVIKAAIRIHSKFFVQWLSDGWKSRPLVNADAFLLTNRGSEAFFSCQVSGVRSKKRIS